MNIERMSFEEPPREAEEPKKPEESEELAESEQPETVALQKEKGTFSRLTTKLKTTIALGAALTGIGLSEGNFEAQAAETNRRSNTVEKSGRNLNDHDRQEHFYEFNYLYSDAIRAVKKAKDQASAEQAATVVDSALGFLSSSEWKRAGNKPWLDERFLKCIKNIEEMYTGLQKHGWEYGAGRKSALESVRSSFTNRLNANAAAAEREKAKEKDKKKSGSSFFPSNMRGVDITIGGSGNPPRPSQKPSRK